MCRLARAIEAKGIKLKTGELIALAREHGCFETILGINLGTERRDDLNVSYPDIQPVAVDFPLKTSLRLAYFCGQEI